MMSQDEAGSIESMLTASSRGDQVDPEELQRALAILRRETVVLPPCVSLTPRQQELLSLIVRAYPPAEVARRMCIQVKTFDTHRGRVFKLLGLRDGVSLAHWAVRHGLLSTEEADEIWARLRLSSSGVVP